jgi:hypothetical protein
MTYAQRMIELAGQLPEPVLAEIVDFAEFLVQKQQKIAADQSLEHLIGSMKNSPVFAGRDPLEIQQEMRSEWVR